MEKWKKNKGRTVAAVVALILAVAFAGWIVFTSDWFVFRELNRQIVQIEHGEFIKNASIHTARHLPETSIDIQCVPGLSDKDLDILAYELMESINRHVYPGMEGYEHEKTYLNVRWIVLTIKSVNDTGIKNSRTYERTFKFKEDETLMAYWRQTWGSTQSYIDYEKAIDIPYNHPWPTD